MPLHKEGKAQQQGWAMEFSSSFAEDQLCQICSAPKEEGGQENKVMSGRP